MAQFVPLRPLPQGGVAPTTLLIINTTTVEFKFWIIVGPKAESRPKVEDQAHIKASSALHYEQTQRPHGNCSPRFGPMTIKDLGNVESKNIKNRVEKWRKAQNWGGNLKGKNVTESNFPPRRLSPDRVILLP